MSLFIFSQVLVSIAIIFDIASFQFKKRHHVVSCLSIAGLLICIHFILLSQWTAAGLMACATIRYFTSIFTTSRRAMWIFLLINLAITAVTYSGLHSILSLLGATIQTVAAFQKNDKTLRLMMIAGTTCWMIHNIIIGSPAAIIMELLFLLSNVIAYHRFYNLRNVL